MGAIRPRDEANEIYRGVAAPKRNKVVDKEVVDEIPKARESKY